MIELKGTNSYEISTNGGAPFPEVENSTVITILEDGLRMNIDRSVKIPPNFNPSSSLQHLGSQNGVKLKIDQVQFDKDKIAILN